MKTIFNSFSLFKKYGSIYVFVMASIFVGTLNAQNKNSDNQSFPQKNPQVDIRVEKKTDKNGNVVQYDSTYTWSWSSSNTIPPQVDSIFKNFHFPPNLNSLFNNGNISFKIDSIMKNMHERFSFDVPDGFSMNMMNDSAFFNPNFEEFFSHSENFKEMFEKHQQLMKKYFNHKFYQDSIPKNKNKSDKPQTPENKGTEFKSQPEKPKELKFT